MTNQLNGQVEVNAATGDRMVGVETDSHGRRWLVESKSMGGQWIDVTRTPCPCRDAAIEAFRGVDVPRVSADRVIEAASR